MYDQRHTEVRSRNQCCHGKAIRITYSECVLVALVIQHVNRMEPYYVTCGLSGSTIFSHIVSNGKIFGKK
jgi:hypothetical protein